MSRWLSTSINSSFAGKNVFVAITVARNLCANAHKDRFNLRNSVNYVATVGGFEGLERLWRALCSR